MTFYEAALSVLEREGKPLHVSQIVETAIRENLLSHVGKSPEEVMQSRLLAMARRRGERKVVATALQTYGLSEWGIAEDPAALEPVVEDRSEIEGPPLRPRERHPVATPEKARIAGRGDRSRRKEEWEERRKKRRFPALAEVAFEILTQAGRPMAALDLTATARERELVSEDLGTEALLNALREDNRRRVDSGRAAAFAITPAGEVSLLERPAEPAAQGKELEAMVATVLGARVAEGRREERGPGAARLVAQANDQRRHIQRLLRRRLGDLDLAGFERAGLALLDRHGYREPNLVRRGRDGALFTVRRRDGLTDLRYAVLLQRGNREVGREELAQLRTEIGAQGAQLGLLLAPADLARDARGEAANPGQPVMILLCGEALAEKFLEKTVGASVTSVEVWDLDEDFFRRCRGREEAGERRVEECGEPRRGDRDRRRERGERDGRRHDRERVQQAVTQPEPVAAVRPVEPEALLHVAEAPVPEGTDAELERRRREEAEQRLAAHERVEAAELEARAGRQGSPSAE